MAGLSASGRIFVLPKGTFRISGTTRENGFALANVAVTATSGSGEALTTISGTNGNFALYGVAGVVVLGTKKGGYADSTNQIDVAAHTTVNLSLVPEKPRTDYRGTYTFSVTESYRDHRRAHSLRGWSLWQDRESIPPKSASGPFGWYVSMALSTRRS
ncbi:MAG TPA: hypothetical protein VNJ03_17215, partial [Vicinamibacterales bacterium]|nr:hypothetical protein [Vicinamibacterales bacterium]